MKTDIKLRVTAAEKQRMEQEAQLARIAEEDDRGLHRRDPQDNGHYRHILILQVLTLKRVCP